MAKHDPRQVVEDLRNHLAMHNRRISFLFGAGTSSAVNIAPKPATGERPKYIPLIPAIGGLTQACLEAVCKMGEKQDAAWCALVGQCKSEGCSANIEDLLSKIRMKIDAIGGDETLLGLDQKSLIGIERTICSTIAKTVNPDEEKIPNHVPQDDFASWVKKVNRTEPIEVFTTNYDLMFERSFEKMRVPVFDGFVGTHKPFFYPECLEDEKLLPRPNWIRLWKIHGSVNWTLEQNKETGRIIRSAPTETGELILPSHRKYDESRKQPYIGYLDRLSQILNMEHSLLIASGYGFGDEHINAVLFGALENRNNANIIALKYDELSDDHHLVQAALQRANLTVIGPNGGVISGVWGLWQLSQPVDDKTWSFMDTAFDSNAMPEDMGSAAAVSDDLKGRMRIGDFKWFCRFLNSMGL